MQYPSRYTLDIAFTYLGSCSLTRGEHSLSSTLKLTAPHAHRGHSAPAANPTPRRWGHTGLCQSELGL